MKYDLFGLSLTKQTTPTNLRFHLMWSGGVVTKSWTTDVDRLWKMIKFYPETWIQEHRTDHTLPAQKIEHHVILVVAEQTGFNIILHTRRWPRSLCVVRHQWWSGKGQERRWRVLVSIRGVVQPRMQGGQQGNPIGRARIRRAILVEMQWATVGCLNAQLERWKMWLKQCSYVAQKRETNKQTRSRGDLGRTTSPSSPSKLTRHYSINTQTTHRLSTKDVTQWSYESIGIPFCQFDLTLLIWANELWVYLYWKLLNWFPQNGNLFPWIKLSESSIWLLETRAKLSDDGP